MTETNVIDMPERKPRVHQYAPSAAPTETIRKRLGMNNTQFASALGISNTGYSGMIARNKVPTTVALAAECLARRAGRSAREEQYFLHVNRNAVSVIPFAELKSMELDGIRYLLIPEPK